jgi:predicted glycoside hydrolase/deacetylase ChbG (UPF0249 family)
MLSTEIDEGIPELSRHPGYCDTVRSSGYMDDWKTELRTLCDPRIRQALIEQEIILIPFAALGTFLTPVPGKGGLR